MELSRPRRIAVIGRGGAGKTLYATTLGRALDLPVAHLDALFWTADWKPVERERFEAAQRALVASDSWVIDGGYLNSDGWPERARRADVIVIADAPLPVCLWRIIRRRFRTSTSRPDRPPGGHEQLSLYFLWWTVSWKWRNRALLRELVAQGSRIVVARSVDDLDRIVAIGL
ncbi:MAG TPA: DNA topology modulation protein FlaR [Candidatus Limnocylindria bacterium]|nr:DNA topology modulation protein FlaR [Candidatus Limnocylindria bacterium]